MTHITNHALSRAMERIPGLRTEDEARSLLAGPVFDIAADFAGLAECFVRIASGHRIVVRDHAIVTVLAADDYRATVRRMGKGRFG